MLASSNRRERPIEIIKDRLLLVEGADAFFFSIKACQAFAQVDIQVLDFGGVQDLSRFLKQLMLLPNYERVVTMVVARDAETNPDAAVRSVRGSLQAAGLSVPNVPFVFVGRAPRIAFMLFPGVVPDNSPDGGRLAKGTLEDLCLETLEDRSNLKCVDRFLRCVRAGGQTVARPHKFRLHALLASKNEFVGMKVGEASQAGAWRWDHSAFEPFRRVIADM